MTENIEIGDLICSGCEQNQRKLIVKSINGDEIIIENEKGSLIKQDITWLKGTLNIGGYVLRNGKDFYEELNKRFSVLDETFFKDNAFYLELEGTHKLKDLSEDEMKALSCIDFKNLRLLQERTDTDKGRHYDEKTITRLMYDSVNYYKITLTDFSSNSECWQSYYSDLGFEPHFAIEKLEKEPEKEIIYKF
jgi:hypothetical protein